MSNLNCRGPFSYSFTKKKPDEKRQALECARKGTRTPTPLREPDFESSASTNSAIRATG